MKLVSFPVVWGAALVGGGFALGAAFHKYKFLPYNQVRALAKQTRGIFVHRPAVSPETITKQYEQDPIRADTTANVETALLPLTLKSIQLSQSYPFPKSSGGITLVEDTIVIVDRLRDLYTFQSGRAEERALPRMRNNVDAFLVSNAATLNQGDLPRPRCRVPRFTAFARGLARAV